MQEDDQRVFSARFRGVRGGDEQVTVFDTVRTGVRANFDAWRDLRDRAVAVPGKSRGGGEQQGRSASGRGRSGGRAVSVAVHLAGRPRRETSVAGAVRIPRPAAVLIPAALCAAAVTFVAAGPPPPPVRPDRVVVLNGGRVCTGVVLQQSYGVEVRQATGRLVLPRAMIRVTAPTPGGRPRKAARRDRRD